MPKVIKKISRGNGMMDALAKMDLEMEASNSKPYQEDNPKQVEDSAAEWMKKCEELSNVAVNPYDIKKSSAAVKNIKPDNHDSSIKSWQKNFSETMKKQGERRKQSSESLLRSLSSLVTRFEEDGNTLQENDQRLQQWYAAQMKLSQQSVKAHRQKLQAIKQIHAEYMKECEETDMSHQQENKRLEKELAGNMFALQEKLQQECRRKNMETFRKVMSMMSDS